MSGISSKALQFGNPQNKKGYNGNELQSKEFNDGSGLDFYDFNARTYDQQIGRFLQIDPKADEHDQEILSPYHFCNNNPILHNDPDGKCWLCKAASAAWDYTKGRAQGAFNTLTAGLKMQYQVAKTAINYTTNSEYRQQANAAVSQAVNNPKQTLNNAVSGVKDKINNTVTALKDPKSYTPENVGKAVGTVEATVLLSMGGGPGAAGANTVKTVGTNAAEGLSPNVQNVVSIINDIKAEAGTIKLNPLSPNQEINMTIQKGTQKLDFRIETHVVPEKFGGNGVTPQRHMNVDLYPNKKVLSNSGHKIVE